MPATENGGLWRSLSFRLSSSPPPKRLPLPPALPIMRLTVFPRKQLYTPNCLARRQAAVRRSAPMRTTSLMILSLGWAAKVGQPRPKVAGRINGVSRSAAERQADRHDQKTNDKRIKPIGELVGATAKMANTNTNVPMISLSKLAAAFGTAGPVANTPSLTPGSSVSFQCGQ